MGAFRYRKNIFLVPAGIGAVGAGIKNSGIFANPIMEGTLSMSNFKILSSFFVPGPFNSYLGLCRPYQVTRVLNKPILN
jgi:hypothetical protein